MTTARIGVPSGFQEAAQSNREIEFKYSEVNFNQLVFELLKVKKELAYYKAQKTFYLNQSNSYQEKVLEMQDKILNHYGIENKPYMMVAN